LELATKDTCCYQFLGSHTKKSRKNLEKKEIKKYVAVRKDVEVPKKIAKN